MLSDNPIMMASRNVGNLKVVTTRALETFQNVCTATSKTLHCKCMDNYTFQASLASRDTLHACSKQYVLTQADFYATQNPTYFHAF
jgi:hypothetical protein